jgi:chlorobactene glucosyltransferase
MMLFQIIITLLISLFMLNLMLNLASLKTPRKGARLPQPPPLVSVIIPARDEENNIGQCLASLQQQDYPNFEIIVLDDNSSDDTPVIISRLAAGDSRIQLLHGQTLPEGWAGKPFACFQAAQQARGRWLLFVDADTRHEPDMLSRVIPLAVESRAAMLSGFPRQITTSLSQKIAIPMMYFILMIWAPFWWLHRSKRLPPSVAYGAFLLFSADAYWKIGGHEAVKARILEDVFLGVEISRSGGRHLAVDLSPVVACHMYTDRRAMWEGFTKWMYSVSALSTAGLILLISLGYVTLLAPFYWAWQAALVIPAPPAWAMLAFLQVGMIYIMRHMVDARFRESPISTIFYPLGMMFLVMVVLYGMARQVAGAGVSWKKRVYNRASSVD